MTSRLFIIDQSLHTAGGHHFEYTRLLARAAESAGVRPIIATHQSLDRQCALQLQQIGEVKPVFRKSVYTSYSYLAGLAELKCKQDPCIIEYDLPGWRNWLARRRKATFRSQRNRHIRSFLEDCARLFSDCQFDESDQIFFTTMSELDLMALASFLGNNPQTLLPAWHIQFHFSIFSGRPSEFESQLEREAIVHHCFQTALTRVPYHNIRFYTTSQELLKQYQRYPLAEFSELPYPVEPRLFENQSPVRTQNRPMRLTIAGGIRREKAQKHYLGGLIGGLWQSHLANEKIEVHLQTSDQTSFCRRSVFGKSEMKYAGPKTDEEYHRHVHFHPHPLPDSDYIDLVGNSDIGLMYYDSRRYYSRRAGILSEFLASGKPVIVPAGCWLARQISEPAFQHAEDLMNDARIIQTLEIADTNWSTQNAPMGGGVVCFDQLQNPWRCSCAPDSEFEPHGVVVKFRWQWPKGRDEFVNITVKCLDENDVLLGENCQITGVREDGLDSLAYFRCADGTRRCEFSFRSAFSDSSISLAGLTWNYLNFAEPKNVPLSRVGLIVADPEALPAAIDEIVTHYQHYLTTAVHFGQAWSAAHDPDCTLDALLDRQCRFKRTA